MFKKCKKADIFPFCFPKDVLKFKQLMKIEAVTYATVKNGKSFIASNIRLALNGRTAQ